MLITNSVGKKLLLYVFLACFVPYLAGGLYITNLVTEKIRQDYIALADEKIEKVHMRVYDGIIRPAHLTIGMLAGSQTTLDLIDRMGDKVIGQYDDFDKDSYRHLVDFYNLSPDILVAAVATEKGGYLEYPKYYSNPKFDYKSRIWYKSAVTAGGAPVISDPYLRATGELTLSVSQLVKSNDHPVGVVVTSWTLDKFQQEVGQTKIGASGYIMVLNENDRFVVSPHNESWLLKTPAEVGLNGLIDSFEENQALNMISLDGKARYVRTYTSPQTGWKIMAAIDATELSRQVQQIINSILAVYLVTLIFITLAISIVTRRITRPVEGLSRGALAIIKGDLNVKLDIKQADEFGLLADTFNHMVQKLNENFRKIMLQNQELYKRQQEFKTLVENAQDIIIRISAGRQILYINPAVEAATGINSVTCTGKTLNETKLPQPLVNVLEKALTDVMNTGKEQTLDFDFSDSNGQTLYFSGNFTPEYDVDKKIVSILAVIRNITERKHLLQLDRLNTIGEMAAGIAHEVRNPMTTVRGFVQFLMTKNSHPAYADYFKLILEELDRANNIISEFLSLTKNKRINFELTDLNKVVETLLPLLQADAVQTSKQISLSLGNIPDLLIDQAEIRQLILNLVRNGLEAMEAGCVTIRTFMQDDTVVLAVEDQGCGIDQSIIDKLGVPFMTTKPNGTGMGLAICYSIAARHNAKISITSSPAGTTVCVCFKKPQS